MQIVPSGNVIGAAIEGIDLAQALSVAEFTRIEAAFNEHAVLSFPEQQLDEPQLIAFARRFGDVERIFLTHYAHPNYPEIMFVSNIRENGRDIGHADAGSVWHTDMSYTARPPRATFLYALEVPFENGLALGDTLFSSAAHAYDSLPREKQRRSEEHTSELQSQSNIVCRLQLEKKKYFIPRADIVLLVFSVVN